MARSAVTDYGGNKCIWRFRMKIDWALKGANALSSNPPGFIRSLGAFEEIYWLFSQTGPKGFAYAAEIEGAHHSRRMSKKCCLCYSGVTLATMAPGAFCATQGRGGGGRTISKLEKFSNLTFAGRVARPNNRQIAHGASEKTGPTRGGRLKPFAQADQWLAPRRGSKRVRPGV